MGNPDSLWVQVLKGVYIHSLSFWDVSSSKAGSWIWRSILKGRDLLKSNCQWNIGNGVSIDLWEDCWVPDCPILAPFKSYLFSKVFDLIDPFSTAWDRTIIIENFPPDLSTRILAIPLSSSPRCDRLFWPFEKDGKYSVKSGYKLLSSKRLPKVFKSASSSFSVPQSLWCILWNVRVLPKIMKLLWQCNAMLKLSQSIGRFGKGNMLGALNIFYFFVRGGLRCGRTAR